MAFLVDTSILARLADRAHALQPLATGAVAELHRRGEALHRTAQNLIEFRNVATRPRAVNGLGLTVTEAEAEAARFEAMFPLLVEGAGIFPAWKALVAAAGVMGKQVHDARLVAVCHVHGVGNLLTFNTGHFQGLGSFKPGLVAVHPKDV